VQALQLSAQSVIFIENQPVVKQMHELVTSTWPQKTCVHVDAKGDCFLESFLVAGDDVSNMRSSIQTYRNQLADFYRTHEKEYLERVNQDGDRNYKSAKERADIIVKQYAYFDTIDNFMFERMTSFTVRIYAMRPVQNTDTYEFAENDEKQHHLIAEACDRYGSEWETIVDSEAVSAITAILKTQAQASTKK
jgi:hypothetical protein